ncbi:hypothetical protein HanXRQr2_Chr13g0584981 [Helianthus annuus]|uniref:Uncharacterized protein n=1 Tax=Helianthus annuus TaxID=4232 RepID=A0A9K3EHF8_HELAN|nr:hypothetical protein HanXRQr2_Chr13g0584981 [Helianthus annuus]KAJ0848929.1 hypothetical protein HanPSC8_Chr13g0563121 [Helianthus annuus]
MQNYIYSFLLTHHLSSLNATMYYDDDTPGSFVFHFGVSLQLNNVNTMILSYSFIGSIVDKSFL